MTAERGVDLRPLPGENPDPVLPKVMFETCPVRASLGVLGRRWALLVLRDVIFFGPIRYSTMLRHNRGMTPRVLSMRLRELREAGLIVRNESEDEETVTYTLTERGRDIIPVVTAFIQYGMKHHADVVFADGRPRALDEVFPERRDLMLGALRSYARGEPTAASPARRANR